MTDSAIVPPAPRFKSDWLQAIIFGFLVGIVYLVVTALMVNDSVAASAYAYGFLVMTLLATVSWRWPEFLAAGWLGAMMGAPMSAQVAGVTSSDGSNSLAGMLMMSIPIVIPFLLFVMPRISKALQQQP